MSGAMCSTIAQTRKRRLCCFTQGFGDRSGVHRDSKVSGQGVWSRQRHAISDIGARASVERNLARDRGTHGSQLITQIVGDSGLPLFPVTLTAPPSGNRAGS